MSAFDEINQDVFEEDDTINLAIAGAAVPSVSGQAGRSAGVGVQADAEDGGDGALNSDLDQPSTSGDDGLSLGQTAEVSTDTDVDVEEAPQEQDIQRSEPELAELKSVAVELDTGAVASGQGPQPAQPMLASPANPGLGATDQAAAQGFAAVEVAAAEPVGTASTMQDLVSLPDSGPVAPTAGGGSVGQFGAPGAPATLATLANYLNDGDAAGLDFWDEFGVPLSPYFNLTSSGLNAKNGVIHYNVTNFPGVDSNGTGTASRIDSIRHALNVYEDILGINFVETTSTDTAVVDLFFYDNVSGKAFANFNQGVDGSISYAWVNVATNWNGGSSGAIGDYTFQTYLHEIGHTLGLGHQGLYNAGAGSPTYQDAYWQNDSWQQTMMSYWSQTANTDITASYARLIGPMAVDWLALENIYGSQGYGVANGTTTGNTTWGFNDTWYDWTPTSGGPLFGYANSAYASMATLLDTNAVAIVDGGGIDTLDLSGFSNNTVIDVSEASASSTTGSISSVAGLIGNLTIAVGTIIENVVGGAGAETIRGNEANNNLKGNGGNDTIYAYGGNDVIFGGDGTDWLYGYNGADTIYGNDSVTGGGTSGETNLLSGMDGNDGLYGSDGNDTMYGGNDNDFMRGNGGNDYIDGQAGVDTVDYFYATSAVVANLTTGTATGGDGTDTLVNLENLRGSNSYSDTLTGNSGNNIIYGWGGNDTISGGSGGTDTVYGGTGNDTITSTGYGTYYGQDGNDYMIMGLGDASEYLDGGADVDTVDASGWGGYSAINLLTGETTYGGSFHETILNFENAIGGSGNETITGTDVDNTLDGGAGNDTLNGLSGSDTLFGGTGNDTLDGGLNSDFLYGGSDNDTLIHTYIGGIASDYFHGGSGIDTLFSDMTWVDSVLIDLTLGRSVYAGNNYDTFVDIENVTVGGGANVTGDGNSNTIIATETGSTHTNTFYGMGGNDTLDGGSGNDILHGGDDDDTLFGGTGADVLNGGTGTDLLFGGADNDTYITDGGDTIVELVGEGIDMVNSSVNYLLGSNLENLTLFGAATFGGGNSLDNWLFGNGHDNLLNGNGGADRMYGYGGDDTYVTDGGDVIGENVGEGNDTVKSSVNYTLGSNLENLELTGTAFYGGGNSLDNYLYGNSSDNMLNGNGGSDKMYGGGGDDTYVTDGGDLIGEGAGAGFDTVRSSVNYTLTNNLERLILTGSAVYGGGNSDANTLIGNSLGNLLNGNGGSDNMYGGDGDDTYDTDGGDVIGESVGEGTDTVRSSVNYTLTNNVENLILTGTAFYGGGNGLANRVTGNASGNTLRGFDGNDIMNGGDGSDVLFGGADSDSFLFNTALGAGNVDGIMDFSVVDDTILLENAIFTGLANGVLSVAAFTANALGVALDASDRIIYETDSGRLYFDADGTGAGASALFAVIDPFLAVTNNDFIVV